MLFIFMLIIGTVGFARDRTDSGDRGQRANDFERFQYEENLKDYELVERNIERISRMGETPSEDRVPIYTSEDFAMREFGGGSNNDRR